MSVKFDASAAVNLIQQMNAYCDTLKHEAIELGNLLELSREWNDPQALKFQDTIAAALQNLEKAWIIQHDYIENFKLHISELRG